MVTDISTDMSTKFSLDPQPTTFEFTTQEGHFAGPGATIRFTTYEKFGQVWLQQKGDAPHSNPLADSAFGQAVIRSTWREQVDNLRRLLNP